MNQVKAISFWINLFVQIMDDRSSSGAFITGIDAGGTHNNLLDQVRVDNEKLKQIVGQFSNKVEVLIDKQRNEYIQAYEGHMQEVQKELHSLREKVADIANDETKNEKTETLKNNQKKYKEEALKLEADSDELLQKIKKLVRRVYTVGKCLVCSFNPNYCNYGDILCREIERLDAEAIAPSQAGV